MGEVEQLHTGFHSDHRERERGLATICDNTGNPRLVGRVDVPGVQEPKLGFLH